MSGLVLGRVIVVLLAGVTVAGCGGGHSHAAAPTGSAARVVPGSNSPPAQPLINASGTTGQPATGSVGTRSGGTQGSSNVIGFPVGPLLPTAVDAGQCQAAQFADKSVYAQIAVERATCAQVPTIAAGADHARGNAYSAAGFACAALPQEPTSGYWTSAYTSYNCRNGNDQIAFNWGTSSSAF